MIYQTKWILLEHRDALDDLVLQAALSIISYCNKQYKECITMAAWACLIFRGESAHDVIQNEAKRWDIINMVKEHIDKDAAQGFGDAKRLQKSLETYADHDEDLTTPTTPT